MQATHGGAGRPQPSSRWTLYEDWDYDGMKQRLESFMQIVNRQAFIAHAEDLLKRSVRMSAPFSAGQHWACFELVAEDGSLVIARARLPRHLNVSVSEEQEVFAMTCEAATMEFLRSRVSSIPSPRLYAFATPGSELAVKAGCAYMLIEGFYGNTLEDIVFDICKLPITQQKHIISQWTAYQAELATVTLPQIGSICHTSEAGEPTLGKLASAPFERLRHPGPFHDAKSYFIAIAQGKLRGIEEENDRSSASNVEDDDAEWVKVGIKVFEDIVRSTSIYQDKESGGPFHFNHVDLGTQNIIVDDDFNFLALIDWEFAQSALWEVNHYPMPFPLILSPEEEGSILGDPGHIAFQNVTRQVATRKLYRESFRDAEDRLQLAKRGLDRSLADIVESPAARIYGCFEKIGVFQGQAETLTREMIRLAFGHIDPDLEGYLKRISSAPDLVLQ